MQTLLLGLQSVLPRTLRSRQIIGRRSYLFRTIAAAVIALAAAGLAYAQNPPVELSGLWYGGGGPTGRVAEMPALTERGHAISDGFDPAYDPHNQCVQAGLVRQLTTPYPMKIEQYPDRVLVIYEEWEIVRTILLTTEFPEQAGRSSMGTSIGRYEDDALVVSTVGLLPSVGRLRTYLYFQSDQTTVEERFSRNEQGQLFQEVVVTDPVMLAEPWQMTRTYGPYEFELLSFGCELRERPSPPSPDWEP